MKKDSVMILLFIFLAIATVFALYVTFRPVTCQSYECFQNYMASCAHATYLNEEPEASWNYEIKKRDKTTCEIEVTLLQAKKGDLDLVNFEGHSMTCKYALGVVAYPDKDMSLCHGLLKEDLQGLLIEKLHKYVIDNLGPVKNELFATNNQTPASQ